MPSEPPQPAVVDRNSKTTLRALIAAVVVCVGAYIWLDDRFDGLAGSLETLGHRVEKLEERDDRAWTTSQMSLWAVRLSKENPELSVPDPAND